MSQLPRYESYKDSGVQWLGEIPSHWDVKQLKFAVTCNDEALGENTEPDYEILYVDISNVSLTEGIKHKEELLFENAPSRARRVVKSGDVLVSTVRTYLKAITYVESAEENLIASTGFAVLRPSKKFDSKFIGYWIQSEGMVGNIVANSVGVSYPAINSTDLVRLPIVELPLSEQKIIADFLDKRLAQVDALISKQETLLEKLAEQRVALISHAVTKGLNPDVEMKESKISWVKDIPNHWNVVPVRYLFEFKNNQRIPVSAEDRGKMSEKIYPYYGASGIIDFVEDYIFDEDLLLVAEDGANLLSRSTPLAFKASGKYWVNNHAHIIKPLDNNLTYWEYVLALYDFTPLISGSAQPKLTKDNLASIKLPNPPDEEKRKICNFLNKPLENLKEQKLKIEKILETLKEYRSTLITQVVTGKIDVRNLKVN